MLLDRLTVPVEDFEAGTGWHVQDRGLCRGDACIPLPDGAAVAGQVDVAAVADAAGMALVADEEAGVWALGPRAGGHALEGPDVPDLELSDLDGNPFRLSALHGRKALLVAWASW